jgi:hypothetical protein
VVGHPAIQVRDALRKLVREEISVESVALAFGVDFSEADKLFHDLVTAKYIGRELLRNLPVKCSWNCLPWENSRPTSGKRNFFRPPVCPGAPGSAPGIWRRGECAAGFAGQARFQPRPVRNEFEKAFAGFLQKAPDVERFAKLPEQLRPCR